MDKKYSEETCLLNDKLDIIKYIRLLRIKELWHYIC
jgi:hypothetical protein